MAANQNDGVDLRYLFLRGLIDHEISQRSRHYLKSAAECTSRAIVSLELSQEPLTSVKQARRLEGIGGETCTRLSKLFEERNFSSLKPLQGRFVSSAGAILVALHDLSNHSLVNGPSTAKDILVPEDKVRERARVLCEEPFREEDKEGFCVAWWRLEVLIKRGFIKRRSQRKTPVLQLLPKGTEIAQRLKGPFNLAENQDQGPSESIGIENQSTVGTGDVPCVSPTDSMENQLYKPGGKSLFTNDRGEDGVVLLVDTQEMGGERVGLGELCRLLDWNGVCYRTRKLRTGDYGWCWRKGGTEVVLPCLVERKRADDIPCTLKEGRFWSQINRMLEWKKDFTDRGIDCNIHYILERKPEEFVVKCVDGCQGIGQCGNPTLPQIKMVIGDLKQHPELLVKETGSLEVTAVLLKSMTNELIERAKKGDFDKLLAKASQEPIVKNKMDQNLDSAKLELTFEEQLELAEANSLKDITEKHHSSKTVLPENKESESSRNTSGISEKNKSELVLSANINMSYDEQVRYVEENSLNDVKHYDGDSSELLDDKQSPENLAGSLSKTGCFSATYPNYTTVSNIACSDTFIDKPKADNTLLQHNCEMESSKICDSQSEYAREKEISDRHFCGQINSKRYYVSSPEFTEGLVDEFDQADSHTVNKRPKLNNARKESVSDFACNNSLQVSESVIGTKSAFTNDCVIHQKEQNESEVYKDKIDDIWDSLRGSIKKKSAHTEVKETISIIDDEIEEITEHRTKVKLKPLKLNMSPSKLFVEPNIPRVIPEKKRGMKRKSASKVKQEAEHSLDDTDDDVNRVSEPDEVNKSWTYSGTSQHRKETVIYNRKKYVDSLCDTKIRNESQIECRATDLVSDTRRDCDTDSNKSIEDIFVDTPSQADFRNSSSFTKESMNINDPNEKDIEVKKWLTNCDVSEEVSYRAEIYETSQTHTVREDSDDSLPEIVTDQAGVGDKPDSIIDLDKHEREDVIDITDDRFNSMFASPMQSGARRRSKFQVNKKTKHKGRNGNDSGYESEDIRGQPSTSGIHCGELDTKIETVLAILPHVHRDEVIEMLQKYGYDVEQSISELLDLGDDVNHSETTFIDLTE